jgi:HK97 family phage portal protein
VRDLIGSVLGAVSNKAPVPYTPRGRTGLGALFGYTPAGDRERQAATMGGNGTLFAIVGGIATDLSGVEWRLWRKAKSGKAEDRVEVTSHAALDVWRQPNPFMSGQEYREVVEQHLGLTGEGWNLFSRARLADWPVELWPIYPHRMYPVPHAEKFVEQYVYCSPDGEKVPLQLRDVGLMRQPHPLDVMRGMSAVEAIGVDLDSARMSREWNRNFFANSAEPGGIVEVERRLSDDEFDELAARWREQHQGVANAHRVAILEQGKWVDRKYTMRDMQFVELRGVSREAIREAYRYPTAMLGESKDVNRAVAEAQFAIYGKTILVPRLDRWKGFANGKFLPAFGSPAEGLEFDYDSPVPSDHEADNAERESKATAAKTYVDAGWPGPAVAEALDLPAPLRASWEKPEPPPAPGFSGPPGQDPAPAKGPATDNWQRAVQGIVGSEGLGGGGRRRTYNAVEEAAQVDLDGLQADWQAALDQLLKDWDGVTAAWRDDIADRVRIAVNAGDLTALTSTTLPSAAAAELLTAALEGIAEQGAGRVVVEAEAQGQTVAAGVVAAGVLAGAAAAVAGLLATGYALTGAREALRWWGYGRTGDAVARGVRTLLADLNPPRAQLGGALTWAQNAGRLATLQAAPRARWFASETLDGSTCEKCEAIDGKELPTFEAAGLAYGGGGYLFCLGRERCRGTCIAVWE